MGNSSTQDKNTKNVAKINLYLEDELINDKLSLDDVMHTQLLDAVINQNLQSLRDNQIFDDVREQLNSVIGLRTVNSIYGLDYLLMNKLKCNSVLEPSDELELIMKPQLDEDTLNIQKYTLLQTIGKGGFSMVYVVRCKLTAKIYALKVMNKEIISQWGKFEWISNEIKVLKSVKHPFINHMFDAIETKKHMSLVLDYCLGGDLFYLLSKHIRFPEKVAKFYLCEIVLALEYLHASNILYRDLKPTNIMLDEEGHVKLIDFGLSLPSFTEISISHLFWGTPEYMAPEMLLKVGHNRSIDYYSIGILLYEMLVGIPPFFSQDKKTMYTSILKDKINFFPHITKNAKDLILKLTQKEPSDRLGANYGFFEIKQHPFFSGVKWKDVYEKKLVPPYIPSQREMNFLDEFISIPIDHQLYSESDGDSSNFNDYAKEYIWKVERSELNHNASIRENREKVEDEIEQWLNNFKKTESRNSE